MRYLIGGLAAAALLAASANAATDDDPLGSVIWPEIVDEMIGENTDLVYTDAVTVLLPDNVEDSADVPLAVHFADQLGDIEQILVIAENNPIQQVARIYPHRPITSLGLKIRLETSTPVRAAVLTADGTWHVGSQDVNVLTPGGCSVPGSTDIPGEGVRPVGEIAMRTFDRGDSDRLKFRIIHPMETGFAMEDDGTAIPAYFIRNISVSDDDGPVFDAETRAAMASNPIVTVDMPELKQNVRIEASDSEDLLFDSGHQAD